MRIGIIGAGFSGLATAKVLQQYGAEVMIFDSAAQVGGIWANRDSYPNFVSTSAKEALAFTDFPMHKAMSAHPQASEVADYLAAYAQRFLPKTSIRLNTRIQEVTPLAYEGWALSGRDAKGAEVQEEVDFLVIGSGVCHQPYMPALGGMAEYLAAGGEVFHDSELLRQLKKDYKKIVVVGAGASAIEWTLRLSLQTTGRVTQVMRPRDTESTSQQDWWRKWVSGSSRENSSRENWLKELVAPSVATAYTEAEARREFSVIEDEVEGFSSFGLELRSGRMVDADLVVMATGYTTSVPFLSEELMALCRLHDKVFSLYRGILPVGIPRLAFNGYNQLGAPALSAELTAYWLAALLSGKISLPSPDFQLQDARCWTERVLDTGGMHHQGTYFGNISGTYAMQLMNDLTPNCRWVRGKRVLPNIAAWKSYIQELKLKITCSISPASYPFHVL